MAQPQPQVDYAANVEKYAPAVDATAVKGIVKHLGVALHDRDSSLVAASDPQELINVRDSFLKKTLGLTQPDAQLDAALNDVMTTMSGDRHKSRVTVYYLLAQKFGKLGLFADPQATTATQPSQGSARLQVKNPRELFVLLLSDARQSTERSAKIYTEISLQAQDPDIREALESRAWITEKDLGAIDRCFQLIGAQPIQLSGRLQDVFAENFREELAEIQNPAARAVFILAKAIHLSHFRIAEYEALVEAADVSGHYAVGILLESCLADKRAFIKQMQHFIRALVASRVAVRAVT